MTDAEEVRLNAIIHDLEQRLEVALLCANQVWWEWDIPTGILKTHAIKDCILGYDLSKIRHHLDFWMDALPPEERDPVWQSLQDHLAGKTEMWKMEHRYRDPGGDYKWVLEAGKVITHNPDGSPLRMVGITQNIHKKKLQDEELERKNEELTAALKLKDLVLAGASHDMKNALNSGWGLAQLLRNDAIGKTEEFGVIEESLRKSIELVSSIHEMAKGHFTGGKSQRVNISLIIQESHNFHALSAQSKQLEFRLVTRDENSTLTHGMTLRRIIDNLVSNAIKFTKSGHVCISDLSDRNTVIIEVSDSGSGVPSDKADMLFTPFTKLSENQEGSGLGLSICQNLAKELAGKITYRPNSPTGSIFKLEFPREPSSDA